MDYGERKRCTRCKELKSVSLFYKTKTSYKSNCKECSKLLDDLRKRRNRKFKLLYGIDHDDYDRMYEEQDGKCYICRTEYPVLFVDHNHETGNVRALLCNNCNTGLGLFKENEESLTSAIRYLRVFSPSSLVEHLPEEQWD